jgi:3-hydroxyacyl-CoA dehydrogenase/enoyl-CoA hydratase/carnithine racemase
MTMPVTECRTELVERSSGRIAMLVLDDGTGPGRPCTLSHATFDSLAAAIEAVAADPSVVGVLVTGKPTSFCAGADLDGFVGLDHDGALSAARRGHEVFTSLQALEVPTLAAINGVCVGGGLELALHCDARTVATDARALAFPEVSLSIVPGWGGTQLAPRLVGASEAVRAIVLDPLAHNRTMGPAEAVERGFADRLLDADRLLEGSLGMLDAMAEGEVVLERDVDPADGLDEALAEGQVAADARTHGATPAPYLALELIAFAARGGDLAEGRRLEQEALAELVSSRQGQAAFYSFALVNRRARQQVGRPEAPGRDVTRVGIVGAGLMGAQLGALHLVRLQIPLVLVDTDASVLARAREVIDQQLAREVARGRLDADRADELTAQVTTTTDAAALAGCDWVMEAVAEDLAVKRRVLAEAERHLDPEAVMATNTSSLSVHAMADALERPERLVGLHFFNPVAVLRLVEVVRPDGVEDSAVAAAFDVAAALGKTAVACADAPGFVVNRVLFRFHLAAAAAARDGTPIPEVDEAIRALGLPMGPFELFDLVGLGVTLHVAVSLAESLGPRFVVDENLRMLGAGDVERVLVDGAVDPTVLERLTVVSEPVPWEASAIQRTATDAVADEIGRMLDERVVDDPRDIDLAMLLGAGWPTFNGGVCHWLDHTGVAERVLGRRLLD